MHKSAGQVDDNGLLLIFLRDRDVPCPVCRYNLRDLTQPQCPECRHELVLSLDITKPRFLWFLLAVSPCMFSGIAAGVLLVTILVETLAGGQSLQLPVVALDILGLISALGGVVLIHYRFAFLGQKPRRQCLLALAVWALHGMGFLAFFITTLILTGGP